MNTPTPRQAIAYLIGRAPELLRELDVTITKLDAQGATGGARVEAPLVFNVHASEARTELLRALTGIAKLGLGEGHEFAMRVGRHVDPNAEVAAFAIRRLDAILERDEFPLAAGTLEAATRKALKAIDRAEERITYGACSCNVELSAPASYTSTTCPNCGRKWDLAELKAWRAVCARDAVATAVGTVGQLVEVAKGVGYRASRHALNGLIRRHAIAPAGTRAGRNLYRFADLEAHLKKPAHK